jgi:hypothetical protein
MFEYGARPGEDIAGNCASMMFVGKNGWRLNLPAIPGNQYFDCM